MKSIPCWDGACLRPRVGKSETGRIVIRSYKNMYWGNLMLILAGYFFLFLAAASVQAAIIQAASCSQQDVQAAIDAARDGDVVVVPEGSCVWITPDLNRPAVSIVDKALTLQGAGIDRTVIQDQTGDRFAQDLIRVSGSKAFRITGFTFEGMKRYPPNNVAEPAISVIDNISGWRIDHCKFKVTESDITKGGRGLMVSGKGVIDQCEFINTRQGVAIMGEGHVSWAAPLTLGTDNAVYIENCRFDYDDFLDGALDAYSGARYVFRHNHSNTYFGHHGLDSGSYRSGFSSEIYQNTLPFDKSPGLVMNSRGGTGVWFNNMITGSFSIARLQLSNYRSWGDYPPWGRCDGSNPIDGNEQNNGYPCRDQIGRSTEERLWDGVNDIPVPQQSLQPHYAWNNTFNGYPVGLVLNKAMAGYEDHIVEGRDYYSFTSRPGYVPYPYPHPVTLSDYPGEQRSLDLQGNTISGQASLSWQAVTGAVNYRIVRDWDEGAAAVTTTTTFSEALIGGEPVYMVYAMGVDGKVLAAEGKLFGQSLAITSPNGGEEWRQGEQRQITWTAQGISGTLTIEILQDNTVLGTVATGVNAAAGSYAWTVGRLQNGSYVTGQNLKIRIRTADGAVSVLMGF